MKNLLLFFLLHGLFSGCNPSETPPISQKLDLISGDIAKDWLVRNAAVTTTVNGIPRQLTMFLGCESDDKWTFFRNGKVEVNDNKTVCQEKPSIRLRSFWLPDDTFSAMTLTAWRLGNVENKTNVFFKISNLTDSTMTLTGGSLFNDTEKLVINYRTL